MNLWQKIINSEVCVNAGEFVFALEEQFWKRKKKEPKAIDLTEITFPEMDLSLLGQETSQSVDVPLTKIPLVKSSPVEGPRPQTIVSPAPIKTVKYEKPPKIEKSRPSEKTLNKTPDIYTVPNLDLKKPSYKPVQIRVEPQSQKPKTPDYSYLFQHTKPLENAGLSAQSEEPGLTVRPEYIALKVPSLEPRAINGIDRTMTVKNDLKPKLEPFRPLDDVPILPKEKPLILERKIE